MIARQSPLKINGITAKQFPQNTLQKLKRYKVSLPSQIIPQDTDILNQLEVISGVLSYGYI